MTEDPKLPLRRRMHILHLLPNLISVIALCAGLTAIRMAVEGRFGWAVALIGLAAALDGIDGRLARMLKSESAIGAELDSLCDLVNFGVTPALVLYFWGMHSDTALGWIAVLIYAVCCMLRLARFNVGNREPDVDAKPKGFVGVPSPAGAMLALLPIYLAYGFDNALRLPAWAVAIWMVFIGALMISRMPTPSFKGVRIYAENARFILVGSVALIAALLTYPWVTLLLLDVIYLAAILFLWRKSARSLRSVV
ncbi:CDP-diacylglycerol--serine O-phosphatidyltransferase [Pseudotabrizicola formosa]|uniref:CDP-diacylglycerol--serine O-phosphatidyltransferase n=1 Tax=Pseudotabrizicola formosa TaxID=2030009 RepID=UPI000CD1196A|nr:CDP-diacylglycerol--serine O-phosphatidyltransferase [Pseudotabrizicola formosa]